jgi:hypothetical protein
MLAPLPELKHIRDMVVLVHSAAVDTDNDAQLMAAGARARRMPGFVDILFQLLQIIQPGQLQDGVARIAQIMASQPSLGGSRRRLYPKS